MLCLLVLRHSRSGQRRIACGTRRAKLKLLLQFVLGLDTVEPTCEFYTYQIEPAAEPHCKSKSCDRILQDWKAGKKTRCEIHTPIFDCLFKSSHQVHRSAIPRYSVLSARAATKRLPTVLPFVSFCSVPKAVRALFVLRLLQIGQSSASAATLRLQLH